MPKPRYIEKRMCRNCGRDGTSRSMYFQPGGVYGECTNAQACERRRIAGDRRSDREAARHDCCPPHEDCRDDCDGMCGCC